MNKSRIAISAFALAIAAATFTAVRADEPVKKGPKEIQMPCCQIDPKAAASLDKLKAAHRHPGPPKPPPTNPR